MEKLYIICLEDQPEVLETIVNQLAFFENHLVIEECSSADEARELVEEIDSEGNHVAVIVSDHVMPGETGVDFLSKIHQDDRFKTTKKVLITGQATHMDTIQAINMAGLDRYISKPWKQEELLQIVSTLLTDFIFDKGIEYNEFMEVLDKNRLFERVQQSS